MENRNASDQKYPKSRKIGCSYCGSEAQRPILAVVYKPIAALKPDSRNPRVHGDKQIQQIANSIKTFGFNVPVLVNGESKVIAGHGRLAAARLLRLSTVPTIRLEHLSEAQARAYMIADNRLTHTSEWDDRLLAEQLKELAEIELNFSLEVTGFEMAEIDTMIEGVSPVRDRELDPADVLAGPGIQVTEFGDVWLLGRHRVLCGNALDKASYVEVMQGQKANAVFTDPPYNDPIDGYVTGFGKTHHREFAMASGEMNQDEFIKFLSQTFRNLIEHSRSGSLHFVCLDWRHLSEFLTASRCVYSETKNLCVWVKESGGQGSLYRSRHELVFVFKSGKAKHRNNIQLGQHGRYRTNVWEYPRANTPETSSNEGQLSVSHPTIKPVAMVADAILDCTSRNDLILDPFLGSGTTVIAAERTGRMCYGIELEPSYVDVTVRRWQAFTQKSAINEKSGKSFAQAESETKNGR